MDRIHIHGKRLTFYLLKHSFTGNSWRRCSIKIRSNPGKRRNGVLKLHIPIQRKRGEGKRKEKGQWEEIEGSGKGDNSTNVT